MTTNEGTIDPEAEDYAEEDRLPWLESADDDYKEGPSPGRIIALIVLGLAVIAAAIFGFNYLRNHSGGVAGTGELINAADGDYKVKPDTPGGMKVDGEGDSVYSTSDGGATNNGSINTRAVPEAPVDGKRAPAKTDSGKGTSKVVTAIPPSSGALSGKNPAVAIPAAGGGGGSLVQLGSFPNEAAANAAWATLSKRLSYIASLGKSVEKAEVAGKTVYRLRVNAGSAGAATALCGKLKVAGEACFVPN